MRKHNGMRPQDIVVLLKILSWSEETSWRYADLGAALHISQSEIAEALNRSMQARLIDSQKRKVFKESLLEFLVHGIKYVFPAHPGAVLRGIPTAHSAPPLSQLIEGSEEAYVWPSATGNMRGQAIVPLYGQVSRAIAQDPLLYEMLALVDALRVGRIREQGLAIKTLSSLIKTSGNAEEEIRETGNAG